MPDKLINVWDSVSNVAISVPGTLWLLLGAFLVFIMVPAIGMLEAGLTRRKNVVHALMKSLSAAAVMLVIFTIIGFGLAFSPDTVGGIIGNPARFIFGGDLNAAWPSIFDGSKAVGGVPLLVYVLFQMMFAAVTLALIGAGVPERMRFSAWLVFAAFFSIFLYPLIAQLIWSPNGLFGTLGTRTGWLDGMGVRDFAGGLVVHAQAGFAGLAITLALGPSLKKRATVVAHRITRRPTRVSIPDGYSEMADQENTEKYGNSLPLAVIGTALLWFGWFGFNASSSLEPNLQGVSAALATAVAPAAAGVVAMLLGKMLDNKYDGIVAISGVLGGLVMITPNAGYVDPGGAVMIGVIAGAVTVAALKLVERFLYHVDDPIGSFPVHGVNGLLGSILVPVFANPKFSGLPVAGLLYGGGAQGLIWLGIQALCGIIACGVVFAVCFGFTKGVMAVMKARADYEEEVSGLDAVDHGTGSPAQVDGSGLARPTSAETGLNTI